MNVDHILDVSPRFLEPLILLIVFVEAYEGDFMSKVIQRLQEVLSPDSIEVIWWRGRYIEYAHRLSQKSNMIGTLSSFLFNILGGVGGSQESL